MCSECGIEAVERGELMKHRKTVHPHSVASCKNFAKGQCRFNDAYCWYTHINPVESVFQKAPQDTDPPYILQKDLEN